MGVRINLGGSVDFVDLKAAKPGDVLVSRATYKGYRLGEGQYSNTKTHLFQPLDGGSAVGICAKVMDNIIDENGIDKGFKFDEIIYKGKAKKSKPGQNAAHLFDVFVLEEDAPEPPKAEAKPEPQPEPQPEPKQEAKAKKKPLASQPSALVSDDEIDLDYLE